MVATTSNRNFPSPFNSEIESGTISFRTDGKWVWLDNISKFIDHNDLAIPENWYKEILNSNFIIPIIEESQFQKLIGLPYKEVVICTVVLSVFDNHLLNL